jgi:hypothetical protein
VSSRFPKTKWGATMKKQLGVGLAVSVVLVAAATAATADRRGPGGKKFTLYEVATSLAVTNETPIRVVGNPPGPIVSAPGGAGAGDQILLESALYADATYTGNTFTPVGAPVGDVQGECTFIHVEGVARTANDNRTAQCQISAMLPAGQIVFAGLMDIDALEAARPVIMPVVGGTGAFRRARGTVTLQQPSIPAFDRFRMNFDLT